MFPGWTHFPEGQIVGYVLILLRLTAFVFAMPILTGNSLPTHMKVLLAIVLSVTMYTAAVQKAASPLAISEVNVVWAVRELGIGLLLGFVMRFYFFAASIGGEIIGISSGLAAAQIYNPALGSTSNVLEQFEVMLATLLFFALNAHHFFLSGMADSFQLLPIGQSTLNLQSLGSLVVFVREVMIFGVKLAAPVLVSVFLAQLGMGIVGRAVPQINVFVTSLQVTVLLTFVVLILAAPTNSIVLSDMLSGYGERVYSVYEDALMHVAALPRTQ